MIQRALHYINAGARRGLVAELREYQEQLALLDDSRERLAAMDRLESELRRLLVRLDTVGAKKFAARRECEQGLIQNNRLLAFHQTVHTRLAIDPEYRERRRAKLVARIVELESHLSCLG